MAKLQRLSLPSMVGRELARGIFSYALAMVIVYLIAMGMWWIVSTFFGIGMDDSDLNSRHRSGMEVYTDYKTGVQYLGTGKALTPRLDKDGNIIVRVP
jgi:hypothetical protein